MAGMQVRGALFHFPMQHFNVVREIGELKFDFYFTVVDTGFTDFHQCLVLHDILHYVQVREIDYKEREII